MRKRVKTHLDNLQIGYTVHGSRDRMSQCSPNKGHTKKWKMQIRRRSRQCEQAVRWTDSCLPKPLLSFLHRNDTFSWAHGHSEYRQHFLVSLAARHSHDTTYWAVSIGQLLGTFLKRWLGHTLFHPFLHPAPWDGDASAFSHEMRAAPRNGEFQGVGLQTYKLFSILFKQCYKEYP